MRIRRVELQHYQVPFNTPFTTSHGTEHQRRGVLIRVTTDEGIAGLGEAAPLPAFGTGTLADTERHLGDILEWVTDRPLEDALAALDTSAHDPTAAPARFALETAMLDIEAQHAGVPLARYLSPHAADSVPVNATVGDADPDRAAAAAREATERGYPAIKLKVGTSTTLDDEINRIRRVRDSIGPEIELRLDANGGWCLPQARAFADRLRDLNISYLEQPLPAGNVAELAQLRSEIDIPIAADEAATTADAARRIIESGAADVLVIKPGVVGGLRAARGVIEVAHAAGMRVVITTSLETGVGIAATLHLAATLPEPVPACGLATGPLLWTDFLVESLDTVKGRLLLPASPGLGVSVNSDDLHGMEKPSIEI